MPDPSFGDPNSQLDPSQIMQVMGIQQPGMQPQGPQGMPQQPPQMGQIGMPGYTPQPGATNVLTPNLKVNSQQTSAWKDPKQYAQAIANPMGFLTQLAGHGLYHLIKSIGGNKDNPLADIKKPVMDKAIAQTDGSSNSTVSDSDTDSIG